MGYFEETYPTYGTMPLPWDASGAFRIIEGSRLSGRFVPAFDWVVVPTDPANTQDLTPGTAASSGSSTGEHGMFFKVKATSNLSRVEWEATTSAAQLSAQLYEAPGGVRGALVSEATMPGGPGTVNPKIPLSAVVEEAREYELVVTGGAANWASWDPAGLTLPYVAGSFEVLGASGTGGTPRLPHFTLGYETAAGGTRYTYNPNGGNSTIFHEVDTFPHTCGMFLTATADHEILSVEWPTNAPDDATHTVRIYEAAGGVAGDLITEGTVGSYPNGTSSKFHIVPVSASLVNGSQYFFEFELDVPSAGTHTIYGYDANFYGNFELNGFQFDSTIEENGTFPYMKFDQCDPRALVGVEEPVAARPAFSLSAPAPNPARAGSMMRFALDRPGEVRLDLLDITGRRVAELYHAWRPAGPGEVRIDGRGLAPGVYLVAMRSGTQYVSRRITIVK